METATQAAREIGPIIFGTDQFQVDDQRIAYADVEHLSWYWHSQTVNLVNTQKAKLEIHVRGTPKPIKVSKFTMWVSPKLAEAYQTLRERTWPFRLSSYLEQLSTRGYFSYEGSDFFCNGMIRNGEDVFDLRRASEEPFELSVKRDGFFSRRLSVPLSLDHDIIHTLIGRFREAPEDPAKYVARMKAEREQREAEHHWFFDVIRLCAKVAAADGRIDPDEVLVVKEFIKNAFQVDETMFGRAIAVFNDARESSRPARFYAQRLYHYHGKKPKLIPAVVALLRDVALSDGEIDSDEVALLTEIANALGFDPQGQSGRHGTREAPPPRPRNDTEEARHGRALGLSGKVTVDGIRTAYRRLVLQFHPDKHHRSGAEMQRAAHERMLEINAAYSYFRERYEF